MRVTHRVQAQPHKRDAHRRRLGGDAHVTAHGHAQASANGGAVDSGDYGDGNATHGQKVLRHHGGQARW